MWRVWLIARGMFYLALALGGIVLAHRVSELWPWSMRPLELRVFMGQVAIIGWNGAIAISGGLLWQHHRLGLVLTGAIGFVQIIGLFINPTPYDWSSPLGILLPLMFAEWLITALVIWALYERR
ncbi:MAG: hypothetical protein GTO41_16620 [Burkholderiales bacterium]|nr:hypothetical protein [Burkholderiales bacterium]